MTLKSIDWALNIGWSTAKDRGAQRGIEEKIAKQLLLLNLRLQSGKSTIPALGIQSRKAVIFFGQNIAQM